MSRSFSLEPKGKSRELIEAARKQFRHVEGHPSIAKISPRVPKAVRHSSTQRMTLKQISDNMIKVIFRSSVVVQEVIVRLKTPDKTETERIKSLLKTGWNGLLN